MGKSRKSRSDSRSYSRSPSKGQRKERNFHSRAVKIFYEHSSREDSPLRRERERYSFIIYLLLTEKEQDRDQIQSTDDMNEVAQNKKRETLDQEVLLEENELFSILKYF